MSASNAPPPVRFGRGLVIGKFHPPHAGHHALIHAALARCAAVSVCALAHPSERLPLALRVAWLREMHPTAHVLGAVDPHPVDFASDALWQAHTDVLRAALRDDGVERVDAIFTSEDYGDELARRFDAVHVLHDRTRAELPVSGTAVRADPARCWAWLAPPVRAHLAKRVVVVGSESTGKTTLAADLARHFRTVWVPEYGRAYTEQKIVAGTNEHWESADFTAIAAAQVALENDAARRSGPVLFGDTDALATCVWEDRYLGATDPMTERIAGEARRPDLYLLMLPDVPWIADGVRDGDDALRKRMTAQFRARVAALGVPVLEIGGGFDERRQRAIARVEALLAAGWEI
jgi:NadR type nicotinamide-nucleotide adenylyltransferase